MHVSKFLFIGKIFIIAFFLINIVNFFPLNFFNTDYYNVIFTTILDTATLLFIGISLQKYIFLSQLNILNQKNVIDSSDQDKKNYIEIKNFNSKKISYFISIVFLVITLSNPIILVLNINRSDNNLSNFIISLEDEFKNKKYQIEELILISKTNAADKEDIQKLENRIVEFSNIKDNQISNFIKMNNKNKFNNTKIIIRNIFLGLLWALAFYKISKI